MCQSLAYTEKDFARARMFPGDARRDGKRASALRRHSRARRAQGIRLTKCTGKHLSQARHVFRVYLMRGWLQSPPGTVHYHLRRRRGLRWHSRWCVLEMVG